MKMATLWAGAGRRGLFVLTLLAGLLALPGAPARAQTPAWLSVAGTTNSSSVGGSTAWNPVSAADASGNILVAGLYAGSITLGSTTLTCNPSSNNAVYVAKWNPGTGAFVWAYSVDNGWEVTVKSIAVENSNVYVVGEYALSALTLGGTTLAGGNGNHHYVAKLTDAGSSAAWTWAQRLSGPGSGFSGSELGGLAVQGGQVYVAGYYTNRTFVIGGFTLTNSVTTGSSSDEGYVAKLTDNGSSSTWQWALPVPGPGSELCGSVRVSGSSVYVGGLYSGGSVTLPGGITLPNAGGSDVFIAKLTDMGSSAAFTWGTRIYGTGTQAPYRMALQGNKLYLTGRHGGATMFGSSALTRTPASTDMYVTRLTDHGSTGTFDWAEGGGSTGEDTGTGLAVSGSSVYVSSYVSALPATFGSTSTSGSTGRSVVSRLQDNDTWATFAWTLNGGATGNAEFVQRAGGKVYVLGETTRPAAFGSVSLSGTATNPVLYIAGVADTAPVLTAATPGSAAVGSTISLSGFNLTGTATISFPGSTAGSVITINSGYTVNAAGTEITGIVVPAGAVSGLVTVTTAQGTSNGVAFTVAAPAPALTVTQGSTTYASGGAAYDFGSVPVGSLSTRVPFVLTNTGNAPLTITTLGSTGSFAVYGTAPVTIPAGQSVTWEVLLNPTAPGPQTGSFIITSDAANAPSYTVNLTGNATASAVVWNGSVSTDWFVAANWTPAVVPTATIDADIPATLRQPVVVGTGAAANRLTVQAGANLSIAATPAPGYLTVHGSLTANGLVTMPGGTLETQADAKFNGGLSATGGEVRLMGAGLKEVGRNGADVTFWNLTVGPGQVRMYNGFRVKRVLRLEGELQYNGSALVLESDAAGTAMVVNVGSALAPYTEMQRYIGGPNAGLGYRHFSSPMGFMAPGSLQAPGFTPVVNPAFNATGTSVTPFPNFFAFDEARIGAAGVPGAVGFDQGWLSPAAVTTALPRGRGFTVNLAGATTVRQYGTPATGPVAVGALSRSGTGPDAGWHLLGNPYPAPIDWDQLARPAGMDNAVYVFRSTGQYTGTYDSYINGMGTLSGGEIAAMQGFFVHVSQPVPSFTFTDAARLTSYSNPSFQRGTADVRPQLQLRLQASGSASAAADDLFVYAEAGATPAFDASFDARKLPNTTGLNVAALTPAGEELAIQGLPAFAAGAVIPLTVAVPQAGTYAFTAPTLAHLPAGTAVWLTDALTGQRTDLRTLPATGYAFAVAAGAPAVGRFFLQLAPAGALATAPALTAATVTVFPNPAHGRCTVLLPPVAGVGTVQAALLNALGQTVATQAVPLTAAGAAATFDTGALARGVYVLRLTAGPHTLTRRVVLE